MLRWVIINGRLYQNSLAHQSPLQIITRCVIIRTMIRSFADKDTEKLFDRRRSGKLPQDIQNTARRKLEILHAAGNIQDLRNPPSNHLEKLKGERKDQHSIRINDQWRICFRWHENDAFEVGIVDYH